MRHRLTKLVAQFGNEMNKRFISTAGRQPVGFVGNLWQKYNHQLVVHPVVTKAISAGVIAFTADIVCQTYFPPNPDKNLHGRGHINWERSKNFTAINTFIFPVIAHYWYDALATSIIGKSVLATAKRVFFDQGFMAPVSIALFLALNCYMEGKSQEQIKAKLNHDWGNIVKVNYIVWIPAQAINFSVIPVPLRVLWANFVGFFWNIYLSYAASGKPPSPEKPDIIVGSMI